MSELEKRQRFTRKGTRHPKVHAVRYEQRAAGARYVALCGQHIGVQESQQVWGKLTCDACLAKVHVPAADIPRLS